MTYEIQPLPYMACAFSGCATGAEVRVWTATGWAQVCCGHYSSIEKAPRKSTAPIVAEVRAAYERSAMFKRKNKGTAGELIAERVPGEDDDLQEAA